VAIVNETFARKYFGNRSALGHMVMPFERGVLAKVEIVGVVRDSRYEMLRDAPPSQLFLDFDQNDDPAGHFVVVKTKPDARAMFGVLRAAVHSIDPNVPVFAMRTLDEQIDRNIATERLVAGLAAGFGLVAAVLAAVGLYGLMAFNVARRTAEIGVRVALGARRSAVAWMVLRDVLMLVAIGAVVALPAAWGLSRYLQSQLYGVKAGDPLTVGGLVLALVSVAAVASFVPARRASRIDPMVALRHE
jgi:predicted lysophospholipase L1 biosynthesis ABC-type transport system permease subunit